MLKLNQSLQMVSKLGILKVLNMVILETKRFYTMHYVCHCF